jgi:dihydroorotase
MYGRWFHPSSPIDPTLHTGRFALIRAIRQGFLPDTISTEIHSGSINSGIKDQLNVMSKFLNMGLALQDVIVRSTWNPARAIDGEQLGHLSVGAVANIAVLDIEEGKFVFVDSFGAVWRVR